MFVSSGGEIVVLGFMKHTCSENNKLKKILKVPMILLDKSRVVWGLCEDDMKIICSF